MSITITPLLNVADVGTAVAFYERLGFQVEQRFERGGVLHWVALKADAARLMLNRQDKIGMQGRAARPHFGDLVLYLRVPKAQDLREHLLSAGVQVSEIERQDYGLDECYVRDPDGYELAIVSEARPAG